MFANVLSASPQVSCDEYDKANSEKVNAFLFLTFGMFLGLGLEHLYPASLSYLLSLHSRIASVLLTSRSIPPLDDPGLCAVEARARGRASVEKGVQVVSEPGLQSPDHEIRRLQPSYLRGRPYMPWTPSFCQRCLPIRAFNGFLKTIFPPYFI